MFCRIDVGGKVITNYLKEVVSHRYWNMMEATYLMNIIKERVCYVPTNFEADMKMCTLYAILCFGHFHLFLSSLTTYKEGA